MAKNEFLAKQKAMQKLHEGKVEVMAELKPCPFCGDEAVLFENRGANNQMPLYGVTCMNCTVRLYGYAKKEVAEEKWNRRVPQTEVHQYGENCTHISNCGTLNLNL